MEFTETKSEANVEEDVPKNIKESEDTSKSATHESGYGTP
jgi:hypothetical protein